MTAFTFPQPGERRNPSAISVPDYKLVQIAIGVEACYYALIEADAPFPQIETAHRLSEALYEMLPRDLQRQFESAAFAAFVAPHLEPEE